MTDPGDRHFPVWRPIEVNREGDAARTGGRWKSQQERQEQRANNALSEAPQFNHPNHTGGVPHVVYHSMQLMLVLTVRGKVADIEMKWTVLYFHHGILLRAIFCNYNF